MNITEKFLVIKWLLIKIERSMMWNSSCAWVAHRPALVCSQHYKELQPREHKLI